MRVKISTYVELDDIKEKDLIELIQNITLNRQLSTFATNCIKLVMENPELLNNCYNSGGKKLMISSREAFFAEMREKMKAIEDNQMFLMKEVRKLEDFIRLSKMLGIEEKVDNLACAQFIIRRKIKEYNKQLGRLGADLILDRRSVEKDIIALTEDSDDFVEFVIEHYDGVINELKKMTTINVPVAMPISSPGVTEKETPELVEKTEEVEKEGEVQDAAMELTDEDSELLGNFFGEL